MEVKNYRKMFYTFILLNAGSCGARLYKNYSLCTSQNSLETPTTCYCTLLKFLKYLLFCEKANWKAPRDTGGRLWCFFLWCPCERWTSVSSGLTGFCCILIFRHRKNQLQPSGHHIFQHFLVPSFQWQYTIVCVSKLDDCLKHAAKATTRDHISVGWPRWDLGWRLAVTWGSDNFCLKLSPTDFHCYFFSLLLLYSFYLVRVLSISVSLIPDSEERTETKFQEIYLQLFLMYSFKVFNK